MTYFKCLMLVLAVYAGVSSAWKLPRYSSSLRMKNIPKVMTQCVVATGLYFLAPSTMNGLFTSDNAVHAVHAADKVSIEQLYSPPLLSITLPCILSI
jgi:hypothetical protein